MKIEDSNLEKKLFIRLNNLRGICALVVLFSHIWGYTGFVLFVPFNKIVTIAVAMFFFLSGYGMMRSYDKKKYYLSTIFREKIPFLLYMSISAYFVAAFIEHLIQNLAEGIYINHYTPFSVMKFCTSTNWYVYELIGFYLIFAFVKHFLPEKRQVFYGGVLSFIAFIILYYSGLVQSYYNSIVGFWFGMFCYKQSYLEWTKRYKKGWIAAIICLCGAFISMFILERNTILFALVRNLAAVGAIVLVLYAIQRVNVVNVFNQFLSKISPELYFYHLPVTLLFRSIMSNVYCYIVAVTATSLALAIMIGILDRKVQKIIKRGTQNEGSDIKGGK